MKEFDVLDIGIIVADLPVKIPQRVLDFSQDTIRVEKLDLLPGGDAANSAVVLSRLGKKVALAGVLGDDGIGKLILETIRTSGVDVKNVRLKPEVPTSTSVVLINSEGERTFVCTRGNNGTLCAQDLDVSLIGRARHINLSSLFAHPLLEKEGGPEFFENAKNAGLTISADTGHDNFGTGFAGVRRMLEAVDIFMPSFTEAKYMSGESDPGRMAKFFTDQTGEKTVVIKLGAHGCYLHEKGRGRIVPAFRVEAVDTTGAGENFLAGFLCAYLDGGDAEACARYACAAAALSTTRLGAAPLLVTPENISALIKELDG